MTESNFWILLIFLGLNFALSAVAHHGMARDLDFIKAEVAICIGAKS